MEHGWSELQVEWFAPVVKQILGDYLMKNGFIFSNSDSISVSYVRQTVLFTVAYLPEESPTYHVMLNTGLVDHQTRLPEIGLWYAIPETSLERNYSFWSFSDPDELTGVLTRIRDEVLEVYAKQLWENPKKLQKLAKRRGREIMAVHERELTARRHRDAVTAFYKKKYYEALEIYSTLDQELLSAADLQRIEYARKHTKDSRR